MQDCRILSQRMCSVKSIVFVLMRISRLCAANEVKPRQTREFGAHMQMDATFT